MALTGRFNFRRTWTGKLALPVEEQWEAKWPLTGMRQRWRDAKIMDLGDPALRALIDERFRWGHGAERSR